MNTFGKLAVAYFAVALFALAGCESSSSDTSGTSMSEMAEMMDRKAAHDTTDAPPTAPTPTPPPEPEEPQVVTAKTPKRGQLLYGQGGYLSALGAGHFIIEHKLIFGQVRQALDFYKASNGSFPDSQDEFDTQIIEQYGFLLPELPDGYEYWYDPSEQDPDKMLKFRPIQSSELE